MSVILLYVYNFFLHLGRIFFKLAKLVNLLIKKLKVSQHTVVYVQLAKNKRTQTLP